jgi:uncharacterized protein (DUF736 family)
MNIGTFTKNSSGTYTGRISTLTVAMTLALRTVQSANPRAPRFEILALSAARQWVQVGALFELSSNATGETFLNGKIEDPSLDKPLYISAFRQEDESYNIVWSRPTRRRDAPTDTVPADDGLPPLPGDEAPRETGGGDGLGESSAGDAFSGDDQGGGRRRRQRTSETVD